MSEDRRLREKSRIETPPGRSLHPPTGRPETPAAPSGATARAQTGNVLAWNNGHRRATANDVAFLRKVIDFISGKYSLDPKRLYVTGISSGGIMSYRVACERADQVAAIGPVAGTLALEDCRRADLPSGPARPAGRRRPLRREAGQQRRFSPATNGP